jgi:hypothetical protein
MIASARQRSKGVPHLPKPVVSPQSRDREPATAAVASGPFPLSKSKVGEEAATPGQPAALARVSGDPPAIHPRESPAAADSAAIIRHEQELSRFSLRTLSGTSARPAIQKHSSAVQNLWTMTLPCGSPRKTRNAPWQQKSHAAAAVKFAVSEPEGALKFDQVEVVVQFGKGASRTRPFGRFRSLRAGSVVIARLGQIPSTSLRTGSSLRERGLPRMTSLPTIQVDWHPESNSKVESKLKANRITGLIRLNLRVKAVKGHLLTCRRPVSSSSFFLCGRRYVPSI